MRRIGGHRVQEGDVVDVLARCGNRSLTHLPHWPYCLNFHRGSTMRPWFLCPPRPKVLTVDRLVVHADHRRLVVERVDVARAAVHEQEDDALGFRGQRSQLVGSHSSRRGSSRTQPSLPRKPLTLHSFIMTCSHSRYTNSFRFSASKGPRAAPRPAMHGAGVSLSRRNSTPCSTSWSGAKACHHLPPARLRARRVAHVQAPDRGKGKAAACSSATASAASS